MTDSGAGSLMLVLGCRGIGAFAAMILGSVSRYAATHASCPVVVVRDGAEAVRGRIGVGIRDQDGCASTLDFAFEEAALRKASLTVLYAWHAPHLQIPPEDETRPAPALGIDGTVPEIRDLMAEWRAKYPGVHVTGDVVDGHPGRALADLSASANLVVLGKHGSHEHGVHGPGKVTHAVLNHAHGPVATVPSS